MADLVQTAANVAAGAGAKNVQSTSGATVTAGMPVYKDTGDGNALKPAQATGSATAICAGIALTGSSDGQPVVYQTEGLINLGATLTVGQVYCVSANAAGAIAPYGDLISTEFVTILGVAVSASQLQLDINVSGVAKA